MAEVQWTSSLEVSRWAKELFSEAKKDTYFSRFFGGSSSAIQVLSDLKAAKGKDITVQSALTYDKTHPAYRVAIRYLSSKMG